MLQLFPDPHLKKPFHTVFSEQNPQKTIQPRIPNNFKKPVDMITADGAIPDFNRGKFKRKTISRAATLGFKNRVIYKYSYPSNRS